jgi:hypothetical protein
MFPKWLVSVGNRRSKTFASTCLLKVRAVNANSNVQQLRPSVRLFGYTHVINWAFTLTDSLGRKLRGPQGPPEELQPLATFADEGETDNNSVCSLVLSGW